jgi:ribosomal protein S18 acetylase RimI-like enzyme
VRGWDAARQAAESNYLLRGLGPYRGGALATRGQAVANAAPHPRLSDAVRVEEATAVSAELTAAMGRLVGQLSSSARAPSAGDLRQIIESPATRLLVARDDDDIVGSLTLALFRIPTGLRAWVEDVVVDEAARGQGVGETLTMEALRLARGAGARTVDLTSRPERVAADRLYRRLGFKPRSTSVYRREFLERS